MKLDNLKTAIAKAFFIGGMVGICEGAIISAKVLWVNDWSFSLLMSLAGFVVIASLIMAVFAIALLLIAWPAARFLCRVIPERSEAWPSWALGFLAILFCLLVEANHNSQRSLFGIHSLLVNGGATILAALLTELSYRLTNHWLAETVRMPKRYWKIVGIAGAICTVSLLLPGSKATTRADDRPNVILLIVDTLRADRLGCYGYERDTSPNIDRIAGKGVLFEQVYVPWASSLPSHTSIFTGLYPSMHGTFPNGNSLDPSMLTLPRILKEYGYTNYAFVTNALVGNDHNFSAGYHTFTDFTKYDYRKSSMTVWLHALNITRVLDKITGNDIFTTLAISHLRSHKKGPFFLWAQWLQPHAPYTPPARFLDKFSEGYSGIADGSLEQIDRINSEELALTEVDKQHYENLYDAEVAFSDYEVGRVIDTIEELGLLENSILIITSDHGENMFEHRLEYGHAGVYESSVRIPLIIVQPGSLKPRRITEVVESIDLMPTLLDMLGIDIDVKFQGVSLMPLIEGGASDWQNAAYSVMLRRDRNFVGIRLDDWKIVLQARKHRQDYELYNVVDDPHERNDVIAQYPQIADSLKSILQAWVDENFLPPEIVYVPGTEFRQEFDAETMARLRSLGYVK